MRDIDLNRFQNTLRKAWGFAIKDFPENEICSFETAAHLSRFGSWKLSRALAEPDGWVVKIDVVFDVNVYGKRALTGFFLLGVTKMGKNLCYGPTLVNVTKRFSLNREFGRYLPAIAFMTSAFSGDLLFGLKNVQDVDMKEIPPLFKNWKTKVDALRKIEVKINRLQKEAAKAFKKSWIPTKR